VRRSEAALFRPSRRQTRRRQSELLGSFAGKFEIGLRLIDQLRFELRVRFSLGQALEVRRALKTLVHQPHWPWPTLQGGSLSRVHLGRWSVDHPLWSSTHQALEKDSARDVPKGALSPQKKEG